MQWIKKHHFYLILLSAAAGEAFDWIDLGWVGVVLLLAAGIPTWLPTFARYVKALKKTDSGWELETREDVFGIPAKQIEKIVEEKKESLPEPQPEKKPDSPDNLSLHAKRVLKTLWHFQCETFGEATTRRWGFGVGRQTADYSTYSIGVNELAWDGLVYADPRGLSYLTNEGLEFCRKNRDALDKIELYYDSFVPASGQ